MPNWKTYESSVRLLSAIIAAHPELKLNYAEIAKAYGDDCTFWAVQNQFRGIKQDAKLIQKALERNEDPFKIPIPKIAGYYGDCTVFSLDHRFRDIKRTAKAMRDAGPGNFVGNSIADKYEQGVTPKAISTRFERMKKEPDWLGNSNDDGETKPKTSTPRKPRATPAKRKTPSKAASASKKAKLSDEHVDDDEELSSGGGSSPTPKARAGSKAALNKTKGGRVTKANGANGRKKSVPVFDDEYDEDNVAGGGQGEGDDLMVSDGDEMVEEYVHDDEVAVKSEDERYDAHEDVELDGGEKSVFQ